MSLTLDVIIVTRNRYEKLLRTVSFLITGIKKPQCLLIVDSSDQSDLFYIYVITQLCDQSHIILKYYKVQHRGISYARNIGIKKAKSDIIAFLDDDELPTKIWAKLIIDRFSSNPSVKALTGPKYSLYPRNYWNRVWDGISRGIYPRNSGWTAFVSAGNSCYRKKFLIKAKFLFDERMKGVASEDSVMSRNFYDLNVKIYFDKKLIVYHEFRTDLKGFAKQWFNYGKGTFEYHKFYTLAGVNKADLNGLIRVWNAFLFSYSRTKPKGTKYNYIPGFIIKDICFSIGFFFSFITGKH